MSNHGTLEKVAGRYQLRYERRLRHPADKVFRALVEPDELAHWFPARIEGERKAGAELRFVFEGDAAEPTRGRVNVFDPPRVFELTWDDELLRFELTPLADGCKLVFITTFVERVIAPRSAAGWHGCLDHLAKRCGGTPDAAETPTNWPTLYAHYASSFGASDFPSFVKRGGLAVQNALETRGLDGYAFDGQGGTRITLLQAGRDADTRYTAGEHEYLHVLDGRYELQLGGGAIVLEAGMEFPFPSGFQVNGKIKAGTRLLLATG
ncbi:MAG: SRPBCC domain-containing protein [Polyangiales bacterium]